MKKNSSILHWQQARELFELYIDKSATQAIKEIQDNKQIIPEVKSKLIKLIQSQSQTDTIIDNAELSFFSSVGHKQEDLSGKKIGEYRLISQIGSGGMSNVYKAKRLDTDIQKFVALKLINAIGNEVSDKLKDLFNREQLTLSKLNHPNIISFHHGGISKNGIPFLVMDFIENAQDIKEYSSSRNLTVKQIVKLIQQVAAGLNFAHQNLIVHKDIKPNNILMDENGVAKIVDFGIATVLEEDQRHQQRIFTPDYASPEQIQGHIITPNSDVFSLSAVFLELLTQKKPLADFEIGNYIPKADTLYVNKLLSNSSIEKDLQNIIKKGLQINPKLRYQSMLEFNQDLGNWLKLRPVSATKKSSLYTFKKYVQRHMFASLMMFLLTSSLAVFIYLILQQKNYAQFEEKKARQVTDFLIDSIHSSDPDITKGREVSVIELLQNAKVKVQESSFADLQLATALKQTIGSALAKVGEYKDAEKLLNQVIIDSPNSNKAHIKLAQIFLQQKQFDKVAQQLKVLKSNNIDLTREEKIQSLQIDAKVLAKKGKFKQAISVITQAIELTNNNPKLLIENQLAFVAILNDSGKTVESIKALRDTLKISEENYGNISTSSTNISMQLANTLSSARDIKKEEIYELFQQTLTNQKLLYSKNHPIIAKTYLQYGFALRAFGELDAALDNALKAREIAIINFDEKHMLTAHIDLLLSQIKLRKGDISAAITQLQNVVNVYSRHYGEDNFETNQIKTTLSLYLMKANRTQEALTMLMPLYEIQKQQLGEFNKATLYVKLNILKANSLLGNTKNSVEDGIQALNDSRKHLGNESIISIGLQMVLTQSHLLVGNYDAAIKLCHQLLSYDLIINHPAYKQKVASLLQEAQQNLENKD